jgi:hypothetical protein
MATVFTHFINYYDFPSCEGKYVKERAMSNNNQRLVQPEIPRTIRLGFVGDCSNIPSTTSLMKFYYDSFSLSVGRGITGVFICDGKRVGQVLEGDESTVDEIWSVIVKDGRYKKINIFEKKLSNIRLYDSWNLHVKDGLIMTLLYPQCHGIVNEINADSTEEILGIMHSYSVLVESHSHA